MSAYHASHYTRPVITLLLALGLTLALLLLVNSAIPVTRAAGPWYVAPPPVGNDGNTCDSEATPCATINAAVAKASAGDTINLAAGTYIENITVTMPLSFVGAGASNTIVDGNRVDRVFNIISGTVSLADLTIQNGNTTGDGGGIYSTGALTLTNVNVLSNTAAGSGGGLAVDQALNLIGAQFMNNTASRGGGVYLNGDSSYSTLHNILLAGNTATSAQGNALFDNSGGMSLDFATIASPTLGSGSAVYSYASHWSTNVFNTLVASHTVGYEDPEGEPGHINAQSTLFSGVITPYAGSEITTGSNSFTGTAGFADPPTGDYHLTLDSDAINRAPCWPCLDTDLDSNPRPAGCGYDIGAYEYQAAPACKLTVGVVGTGVVTPTTGEYPYAYGATVILSASTSVPWSFGGWNGDASNAAYSTRITMDRDKSVTATFGLPVCFATPDNGLTVESSPNAAAVQRVADLAPNPGTVKVAGTCAGVQSRYSGYPETLDLVARSLTVLGGYTVTNWITSYPVTQPTVLDAQQAGRVIYVVDSNLTLADLTIQNGYANDGGGILGDSSNLTLTNVAIINNTAIGSACGNGPGGGIFVSGNAFVTSSRFEHNVSVADYCTGGGGLYAGVDLILSDTVFLSNTAAGRGGGAYAGNNATLNGGWFRANQGSQGGGLYADADLRLTGTQFVSNTAQGSVVDGGNGGGAAALGLAILNGGLFERNLANWQGGGLYTEGRSITGVILTDTHFISNTAGGDGGGAYTGGTGLLNEGLFQGNEAGFYGGGLCTDNTLTLTGTQLIGNVALYRGGGLYLSLKTRNESRIINAFIAHNMADIGGGIANLSKLLMANSTVAHNVANSEGGGLYNYDTFTATNSTFSGNFAQGSDSLSAGGGGISQWGPGGGSPFALLENVTLSGNQAPHADERDGVWIRGGNMAWHNVLLAGNGSTNCTIMTGATLMATADSMADDATCVGATSVLSTSLTLPPLADNGGSTWTHALSPDSPAIDAGNDATCLPTDQRGVSRPQGAHCDSGAYEGIYAYIYLPLMLK